MTTQRPKRHKGVFAGLAALMLLGGAGSAAAGPVAASLSDARLASAGNGTELSQFVGGSVQISSPYSVIRVGHKLKAVKSGFTPQPQTYQYRWLRDGEEIPKADKSTYIVQEADIGTRITVSVTAVKLGYRNSTVNSEPTVIIQGAKATTPETDQALFTRIAGGYTNLSETGDFYADLRIAEDGSFTYAERAWADYSDSLPPGYRCPTVFCFYESSQIGRFGGVEYQEDGSYIVHVVAASSRVKPGTILSKSENDGSDIAISPIVPFAVGQTITVTPTTGKPVPAELKTLACEQYQVCKNGNWSGWTIGNFHSYGK